MISLIIRPYVWRCFFFLVLSLSFVLTLSISPFSFPLFFSSSIQYKEYFAYLMVIAVGCSAFVTFPLYTLIRSVWIYSYLAYTSGQPIVIWMLKCAHLLYCLFFLLFSFFHSVIFSFSIQLVRLFYPITELFVPTTW